MKAVARPKALPERLKNPDLLQKMARSLKAIIIDLITILGVEDISPSERERFERAACGAASAIDALAGREPKRHEVHYVTPKAISNEPPRGKQATRRRDDWLVALCKVNEEGRPDSFLKSLQEVLRRELHEERDFSQMYS
ncbi:MAG: hypothetical protein ACTSU5_12820 [Promethearchaeota archaeon]